MKIPKSSQSSRAEDIVALFAFLTGPEAGFVTGAEFLSDGGMTRKMIYAA